ASDCEQLTTIKIDGKKWPSNLVDLRLDRCRNLGGKLPSFPATLRRISLSGPNRLTEIPGLWKIDYVNLAYATSLERLPNDRGNPRTLFLYGSGVMVPPASEHGKSADENVAFRIREYFKDVELVGEGDVRRCKLLLLGNGAAGKTSLAMRLIPGQDP